MMTAVAEFLLSIAVVVLLASSGMIETGTATHARKRIQRRYEAISKRHDSRGLAAQPEWDECCPSDFFKTWPLGGLSLTGTLLELYRNDTFTQYLYELICKPDVKRRPCRMINPVIKNRSRCVQRYSYSYATVRDYNTMQPWRTDYIRVDSGCSCFVKRQSPGT